MAKGKGQMAKGKCFSKIFLPFAICLLPSVLPFAFAEWLPPAHEVFAPLQADPRELQYAVRLVGPVGHKALGEAAAGDYVGLYRRSPEDGKAFQVSVGGGFFGRF